MLRDICIKRGVVHVLDDVVDVELDDRGFVAAMILKETGRHPVELVIDCTGFRGLVINQALKEPFLSFGKYLGNDRAMAVQIPHKEGAKIKPVTKSTALGAGWSWRVPLFNRIGTGYVFSSAHRDRRRGARRISAPPRSRPQGRRAAHHSDADRAKSQCLGEELYRNRAFRRVH